MDISTVASYLAFGCIFVMSTYLLIYEGHLWKPVFFRKCLRIAILAAAVGFVLEATNSLDQKPGLTAILMSLPVFLLVSWHFSRMLFLKLFGTEPYLTSDSSTIGSIPFAATANENRDGKKRKFEVGHKVMAADFAFSIVTFLVPILVTFWLVSLLN